MKRVRGLRRKLLRPKFLVLAVASCFASGTATANPTGAAVVNGQVSFSQQGNLLSITNSPGSIINWRAFSIGSGETTRFIQQSASSTVLNRVVGIDPSLILGTLQSNGRVFLINPNGIVFGAGSQIDVGALVASTLRLSDADFLAGRYKFTETPGAGSVVNKGAINAASGGSVYLIGSSVENHGVITTPQGEVVLAAGKSVEMVDTNTPDLRVEIKAPDNQALNMGRIIADSGRVGIYAGLIRNGGTISANTAKVNDKGQIVLLAKKDVTLDKSSVITANGPQGGSVKIQSESGTTLVSGTVEAKGSEQAGGTVHVLGQNVGLVDGAKVDVSGQSGGGTALVGGDYQGKNAAVQNASATYVSTDSSIKADAIGRGDGGKVIVWANDANRFYGSISARGGAFAGNGGFVETSGKQWLDFRGTVDTRAPFGNTGTLLLDPTDITISTAITTNGSCPPGGPCFTLTGNPDTSNLNVTDLVNALGNASVTVNTSSTGNGAGDINVNAQVSYNSANALTLQADRNINVIGPGAGIANSGTGSLALNAVSTVKVQDAVVTTNGAMTVVAGNLNVTATAATTQLTAGGTQTISASGVVVKGADSGTAAFATIASSGNQNLSIGAGGVTLIAGTGGDTNSATINKNGTAGTQTITSGTIAINGGTGGTNNFAGIQAANQNINVFGNILLFGNNSPTTGGARIGGIGAGVTNLTLGATGDIILTATGGNTASLGPNGTGGNPTTLTVTAGGNFISTSSGGAFNRIGSPAANVAGGDISITTGGDIRLTSTNNSQVGLRTLGNVTLNAGTSGSGSIVMSGNTVVSSGGHMTVTAHDNLTVTGGVGSGNAASMLSSNGQDITATNVTVTGGSGGTSSYAEITQLGANANQTFNFNTGGTLTMQGGASGNGNRALIQNSATTGVQRINGAPTVALKGGTGGVAGLTGNAALLWSNSSQVFNLGSLTMLAGLSGVNNYSTIQGPVQTITVNGDFVMSGGGSASIPNSSGGARIGGLSASTGTPTATNLALTVTGNMTMTGGSATDAGANLGSNFLGGLATNISVNVGGNITLNQGSVANSEARIGSPSSNVAGGNINITAGGNIALNGTTLPTEIRTLGDVTVQAGGTITEASAATISGNNVLLSGGGNISLGGGTTAVQSLGVTTTGGGNLTVTGNTASSGTMAINASGDLLVRGNASTANLTASSGQTLSARAIEVVAENGGTANVTNSTSGDQTLTASGGPGIDIHTLSTGGTVAVTNSAGNQSITATNADHIAANGAGGNVSVMAFIGSQAISITGSGANAINVGSSGAAGQSYVASLSQNVTAGASGQAGSITVIGTGANNRLAGFVTNGGGAFTQTISTAGTLSVTGGSASNQGANFNSGVFHNSGGIQTINADSIVVQGGTAGNNNGAFISSVTGNQIINAGVGGITIAGGATGTNNRSNLIQQALAGTQTINSGNLTVSGGANGTSNTATLSATNQNIHVVGDVVINGGASGTLNGGRIGGNGGVSTNLALDVTGNMVLTGGANGANLGSNTAGGTTTNMAVTVGGNFVSNANSGGVNRIGSPVAAIGGGNISIIAGNDIQLNGTTSLYTTGNVTLGAGGAFTEGASAIISGAAVSLSSGNAGLTLGGNTTSTQNLGLAASGTGNIAVNSSATAGGALNVNAGGDLTVRGNGTTVNLVSSSGQTINARAIEVVAENGGSVTLNNTTSGSQNLTSSGGAGIDIHTLSTSGSVTVTNNASGGAQNITATNADHIAINGAGGSVLVATPSGTQTVSITGSGANAINIGSTGALGQSYVNARTQNVTAGTAGQSGSITVIGSATNNALSGLITNGGSGSQTVSTVGTLSATGGSASNQGANFNSGVFHNGTGTQTVNAASIIVKGGTAGNNNGGFVSSLGGGAQVVNTGVIEITGGTSAGSNNRAGISTVGGGNQTINTGGATISVTGGATGGAANLGNTAFIQGSGTQTINSGTLSVNAGAGGTDNSATITSPNQNISVTGDVLITGGGNAGTAGGARIGGIGNGVTNLTLNATGDIVLTGGDTTTAGLGTNATGGNATTMTITAGNSFIANEGAGAGVRIGGSSSALAGGNISITATGGVIELNGSTQATAIRTLGNVTLNAATINEGANGIIEANALTTNTTGAQVLTGPNKVSILNATSATSDLLFNNTRALTVTGMSAGGNGLFLTNSASVIINGNLTSGFDVGITTTGAGSDINFLGGNVNGFFANVTGTGSINLPSGSTTFYASLNAPSMPVNVSGANVVFDRVATVDSLNFSAGTISRGNGGGATVFANSMNWSGGTISGEIDVLNSLAITAGASPKVIDFGFVQNYGAGTFSGGQNVTMSNGGMSNLGTLDLQGDVGFLAGTSGPGSFINLGTLTKSSGSGVSGIDASFTNIGIVNVNSGTLALTQPGQGNNGNINIGAGATFKVSPGSFVNFDGGVIAGNGTVDATGSTFTNLGALRPGGSGTIGTLTISGDVTLGATSVIDIEAQGSSSAQYDKLAVSGNADLNGTLKFTAINGYTPVTGSIFVPVTYGTHTGTFSSLDPASLNASYNPTSVAISDSVINSWVGTSGNWATSSNWSLGHVPLANEAVLIDVPGSQTVSVTSGTRVAGGLLANEDFTLSGGSLALGAASTFNGTLTLSGGTLQGAGDIVANGEFNWSKGQLAGTGMLTTMGASTLTTPDASLSLNRNWTNLGTVTWQGTSNRDLAIGAGKTLTNAAAGTVTLAADVGSDITGTGTFQNNGSISGGGASITSTFNNAGTVNVTAGTLRLTGAGTDSGTYVISAGATLEQGAGVHNWTGNNMVDPTSAGTLQLTAGTLNVNADTEIPFAMTVNSNATLAGSGTLTIDGIFNWTGGSIGGTGTLVTGVNSLSTLSPATGNLALNRNWTNNGLAFWQATAPRDLVIGAGKTLTNAGIFVLNSPTTSDITGSGTLQNDGAMGMDGGGQIVISSVFNNAGAGFAITAGSVKLTGNGTDTSSYILYPGTALDIAAGTRHWVGQNVINSASVGTLQLSGGTLNVDADNIIHADVTVNARNSIGGAGSLQIDGNFNWSGGTLTGSGALITDGFVTLTTPTGSLTQNKDWLNLGTVNWQGSVAGRNWVIGTGKTFTNDSFATLNLESVTGSNITGGTLQSNGTMNMNAAGTMLITSVFNNAGITNVNNGALQLKGNGVDSGTYAIAAGATLEQNGGVRTWNGSNMVDPASGGTLQLTAGTLNIEADNTLPGSLAAFNVNAGSLGGAGNVTVDGAFNWSGGALAGTGTLTTNANTTLATPVGNLALNKNWTNQGTVSWQGTLNRDLVIGAGKTLTNASSGSVDLAAAVGSDVTGSGTFQNDGTVAKTSAGLTLISAPFSNAGVVDVNNGTLRLSGNGTDSGTYAIAAGTTLEQTAGTRTWTGNNMIDASSAGTLALNGGTLNINNDNVLPVAVTVNSKNTVGGSGDVEIDGAFNWSGGSFGGTGTLTTAGISTLTTPTGSLALNRNWTNVGTVNWQGSVAGRNWAIGAGKTFTNASGATTTLAAITGSNVTGGVFVNNGTLDMDGAGTTQITSALTNPGLLNVNTGTVQLTNSATNSGTINISSGATLKRSGGNYTNTGLIAGNGTFDTTGNTLINSGTLAPGGVGAVGTFTVLGKYQQTAGGTLLMDLGGTAVGQYDVLSVTGLATLAGTLSASVVGAYTPAPGDSFQLITYGSRVGVFGTTIAPTPYVFNPISYGATSALFVLQ